MPDFAITVIGRDRPGIIADASAILAGLGLNLTDSTMTRLRGHFTMTLICAGPATTAQVEASLSPLGGELVVTVREVGAEALPTAVDGHFVLSLHGADRLGIVAAATGAIAAAGGNITDLSTRLVGALYVVIAEVDLPSDADTAALAARLREIGGSLGVEASLRPAEVDLL